MRSKSIALVASTLVLFSLFMIAQRSLGQSSQVRLITQPIDESKMIVLKGNTHPYARAEFDRGAAPASLTMDRMMLVMKRSPAQESVLETFLAQQVDVSSPNYHKWLTPDQFGERFGASEEDIAQVISWLRSQGFQVASASHGRGIIEFSGNAGQVQSAFRTAIHSYNINGKQYWANATDPQIPQALAPAVAGVVSLHNFPKHPASHALGPVRRNMANAKAVGLHPSFTFNGGCEQTNCFALGPQDFTTIYNITPLYSAGIDGTGEVIAVVADSNINATDVAQFRSIFGLPAKAPNIIVNGTDPGLTQDEVEAVLDTEWSGAVAKNATIDLVVSASTNASFGGDLSSEFIIDNNLAPIMSESFGECELFLGATNNAFYNTLYTQGVAEGITISISTGDSGSVGCLPDPNNPFVPNTFGLGVSGVASTGFNVAVGGTDFDQVNNAQAFWNTSNTSGTQGSAKGHIPETTWNDSCTNTDLGLTFFGFSTNPEANCNNATLATDGLVMLSGANGGVSNCTMPTGDAQATSQCAGGNPKPSWQVGPGVPADGHRDLPDISLFAATGTFSGSFYVICQADDPNFQDGAACSLSANSQGNFIDFSGVGGTSVSTQVFAGIMALVDQKAKGPQGNVNPKFYSLAASQAGQCPTASPAANCVFFDVSKGSITQPCTTATPAVPSANCTTNTPGDLIGVLTGFNAGTGYDLATGLGSINVNNLAQSFATVTGTTGFSVGPGSGTATVTAGSTTTYPVTVTGAFGFAGDVNFACSGVTGITCSGPAATVSAATPTATSMLTITASSTANVAQQIPGGNGASKYGPPSLGPSSSRALVSLLAITLVFCGGLFIFAPKSGTRRATAVFALMIFGVLSVASCGGGGGGTPPPPPPPTSRTVNLLITGTSGSGAVSSTVVTLTIE
jgi:subtilase family serine protease